MAEVLTIHPYWFAICAALAPGILGWWWSRAVSTDAAVLPEWQMALVKKLSFCTTLCTIAIVASSGWNALWLLPLEFIGLSYSTHRVRRVLLGETWPLYRYLAWRIQALVGIFGFWTLIALAPAIVANVGAAALWWVAAAFIVVAVAWLHLHSRVLLFALRATPLLRPDLDEVFQRVFQHASSLRPTLWRAGASGSVIANALALPALGQGRVLFFDTLLEQLNPEEIAAILAHEVAHLEYYNRRRLLRGYVAAYAVIAITILGTAVTTSYGQTWLAAIAPAVVFGALWARARGMQHNETASDLRAVELCGNPEALVSALTRIYAINHIPRRVSLHAEERATHPSLARRIRDIRERARTEPPLRLSERLLLSSTDTGRFAILDRDHVSFGWADRPVAGLDDDVAGRAGRIERIAYSELGELRLATTRLGVALTAVDHHARRWTLPLQRADVSAAQAALDVVDQLLSRPPATAGPDWRYRLTALASFLFAWTVSSSLSIVVPALLTMANPTRPVLVGLAAALSGAALLSLGGVLPYGLQAIVLALLAAGAIWQARRPPAERSRGRYWTWVERVALAVPILAGIGMIAVDGWQAFPLHVTLRDQTWLTASLMAAMGYLSVSPLRASRRLGAIAGVVAAAAIWVGSPWFLVQVAADPLAVEMPLLQERRVPLTWISQNTVEEEFSAVSLAPDGRHFLLSGYADDEYFDEDEDEAEPRRYVVGGFDGWSRRLSAMDSAFVDSDQLLTLGHAAGGSELRTESLRGGDTRWTLTIPNFVARTLSAGPNGRWRAVERRRKRLTRIEGTVGAPESVRTDWSIVASDMEYPVSDSVDDGHVGIAMAYRWQKPLIPWSSWDWRSETSILRVSADRTTPVVSTRLTVNCLDPAIGVTGFVCIAFDGRWSRLWRFDADAGRLIPLGQTRALVWSKAQTEPERISGSLGGRPMVLKIEAATIDVFTLDDDQCLANDHALAGNLVATSCMVNGETIVKLYRIGAPGETSAP